MWRVLIALAAARLPAIDLKLVPVQSSDLKAVGYDEPSKTLHVEFHSGGLYEYAGVPEKIHQALRAATSVGRYFHANVKDRYPTKKLR